ncbi:UDP-glucose/GDP-mannose dehydrogenase family protein [Rickettsiales endosymbiont of Peranema trichophorum]|uniref:UDP-glucose dehydrogenase family protein n=1 Tax=Rickettsiales endosymbiont of Peranema trichophorum TaxID=2486577 RepID=UPI00102319B5|nr:UDP-glucose/GDP-mannose dehydrogenase family protein [Rickettsiales endosymbiont of Peranema trichophorum]RZI47237.1 UDP-glucose/GDP-mannose dehydrogenase family protein [Rickettsiales endosymbiont of Peranema trichophorum]
MHIVVIGSGYVGIVTAACFAKFNLKVTCVDHDQDKVRTLATGQVPIYEPELEALVQAGIQSGNLSFSSDKSIIGSANVIVVAVGTPSGPDGTVELSYLHSVVDDIVQYSISDKIVMIKSTVPVGTAQDVKRRLNQRLKHIQFQVISNPEFLREGNAVQDFLHPDRIVIGCDESYRQNPKEITTIYSSIIDSGTPILFTDNQTAELIKYAANGYLAMRLSFINEIANIAEKWNADVCDISKGIGMDKRIGPEYLKPGPGFGGSCFPKDTLGLLKTSEQCGEHSLLVDATIRSNDMRKERMLKKITDAIEDGEDEKTVAVLGLAFKNNTDDMRDSPSISIIEHLLKLNTRVQVYDPKALKEGFKIFGDKITYCTDLYQAVTGASGIVIATEWSEFASMDLKLVKQLVKKPVIVDLRNILSLTNMRNTGFRYVSIGRPNLN